MIVATLPRATASIERSARSPSDIAGLAVTCLNLELATWPKPGLVSPHDSGSHSDMNADLLRRSAERLKPYFAELAEAGATGAALEALRAIGVAAEAAMLDETGGVNTHRGAIFGLGLLCAAAGLRAEAVSPQCATLGDIVRSVWGPAIAARPIASDSHGAEVLRRHGAAGARGEASRGFPTVYGVGLPAYRDALARWPPGVEAARVQAIFALIAAVEDTNLLHRGGVDGLLFAQAAAAAWLRKGGMSCPDWQRDAVEIHGLFVARRLSPGGSADLLAMTLFADAVEAR